MIKALQKLNVYHKCVVLSGLLILFISLCFIPFYFFNMMDIPLGLLLGGIYGMTIYFIIGILENKKSEYYKWAVFISIMRFFLFAALLILVGLCYYKWELKIFNIFSVVGGYFICLIILVLLFTFKGKKERKNDGSI